MDNKCKHKSKKRIRTIAEMKERTVSCNQPAPRFFYFDGRDRIPLCATHAEEYRGLHLTVNEL